MSDNIGGYSEEELDELEDELLEEDFEEREEKMVVEGRSVFEIDRLKKSSKTGDQED